ncbi:DNA ligase D [Bacillus sp. JJ722]|uniref:DNA ligase D n=1 Tax=Bacillus sp. JJ722 TaxID=3122973 RepID=UPI0030004761
MIGIKRFNKVVELGMFSQGLKEQEKNMLIQTILSNQKRSVDGMVHIDPGICIELSFQTMENDQLCDTIFMSFQFDIEWEQCTLERLVLNYTSVEIEVKYTNLDKVIWENPLILKEGVISYLSLVSPFMLPFLKQRILTTIRYPNGVSGESFFQKNCPDYAPSFIQRKEKEGNHFVVCNDLSTLLWLGNQLAIEFHIPFQTINADQPLEIVFDLDPPSRDRFHLAIKAAIEMRKIFDSFNIVSYPKLSGSKGIQIHIPIANCAFTYTETRLFTSFIAHYLVEQFPADFTIERLKKNRGGKLYIDFIQHAEGKTIICPYSARGKEDATVATPLLWDEVNENLKMEQFTIPFVLNRLSNMNCPMSDFFEHENPSLVEIISKLKENV